MLAFKGFELDVKYDGLEKHRQAVFGVDYKLCKEFRLMKNLSKIQV